MSPIYTIIEKEVNGDVEISENSQFNNICADTVIVHENITARLFGTVKHKLIIKKGGRVYLHGNVVGTIENDGGELHKY
jgi:hypothetical protein